MYTGDGVLLLVPSRNPYGPLPRPPPPHVSLVRLLRYLLFFLDPATQSGAEQRGGRERKVENWGEREKLGNGRGKHRDRDRTSRNPRMHSLTHSILISSCPRGLVFRVRIHRASLELADLGSFSFFYFCCSLSLLGSACFYKKQLSLLAFPFLSFVVLFSSRPLSPRFSLISFSLLLTPHSIFFSSLSSVDTVSFLLSTSDDFFPKPRLTPPSTLACPSGKLLLFLPLPTSKYVKEEGKKRERKRKTFFLLSVRH